MHGSNGTASSGHALSSCTICHLHIQFQLPHRRIQISLPVTDVTPVITNLLFPGKHKKTITRECIQTSTGHGCGGVVYPSHTTLFIFSLTFHNTWPELHKRCLHLGCVCGTCTTPGTCGNTGDWSTGQPYGLESCCWTHTHRQTHLDGRVEISRHLVGLSQSIACQPLLARILACDGHKCIRYQGRRSHSGRDGQGHTGFQWTIIIRRG